MLQAQKHIKLKEMVGDIKEEEEPAGDDILGPSAEVLEGSSGNVPFLPLFFQNLSTTFNQISWFFFLNGTSQHVCFVSPVDDSSKEEEIKGETKEE